MLDLLSVSWCSVCNGRPSDGVLTVEFDGERVNLEACTPCGIKAMNEGEINVDHDGGLS